MSNIVTNIFTQTDKLNFLTGTDKLQNVLSKSETFGNSNETEEEKRERICKMVVGIRVLFVLTIVGALFYGSTTRMISMELFMGLAILALLMPDIVLILMIIIFAVNSSSKSPTYSETSELRTSQLETSRNKYTLTSTPDIFLK